MNRRLSPRFDRKRIITTPTMIQLQVIFQFSLLMKIHNTAWLMAVTFACYKMFEHTFERAILLQTCLG